MAENLVVVAVDEFYRISVHGQVPVVHAVAEAVFEDFAVFADTLPCPLTVAEGLEAGVPDFPEVVGVYVSLAEMLAVDVGAGTDGAVDEDGGDVDARVTEVGSLTHLAFVRAEVTFAAKRSVHNTTGGSPGGDEVHELDELGIGEVQLGVVEGAADGDDGEDTPLLDTQGFELVIDLLQMGEVALVDASDHVEVEAGLPGGDGDGIHGPGKAAFASAHPVVVFLQSVEADGQGTHLGGHESPVHLFVVEPSVADDAPAHAAPAKLFPYLWKVGPQEGFSACDDYGEGVGPLVGGDGVESLQEVLEGHILFTTAILAIAPTVAAA